MGVLTTRQGTEWPNAKEVLIWTGTTWERRTWAHWNGTSWEDDIVYELELYRDGEGYSNFVNGIVNGASQVNNITTEPQHIRLWVYNEPTEGERAIVTDSPVNLTDFNTVYIEWAGEASGATASGNSYSLIASTNKNADRNTHNARYIRSNAQFSKYVQSLDVSSLLGNHFIRVHAYHSSGEEKWNITRVFKLWLE